MKNTRENIIELLKKEREYYAEMMKQDPDNAAIWLEKATDVLHVIDLITFPDYFTEMCEKYGIKETA